MTLNQIPLSFLKDWLLSQLFVSKFRCFSHSRLNACASSVPLLRKGELCPQHQRSVTRAEGKTVKLDASYGATGESTLTVTATVTVPTQFMQIFGHKEMTISSTSVVKWGNTKLRIALALDNTGSMGQANKLPALKTATKELLKMLQGASDKPGDVQVSIVPFAKDVNVGAKNYTAPWVKWDEWDAQNGQDVSVEVCDNTGKGKGKGKCTTTTK